jgi:hypothetical protein
MLPHIETMSFAKRPRSPSAQSLDKAMRTRRFLQWVCENEALLDRVLPKTSERPPSLWSRLTRSADRTPRSM